jgi:hypothetical protein
MSNLFSSEDLTESPDHIYYDLSISNSHSIGEIEPHLKFNETRTTAIIEHPERYKLSIVRFMVDTHSLPIMQPTIMKQSDQLKYFPNNVDMNRTVYSITIEHGIDKIMEYVQFDPQDTTVNMPASFRPNGSPDYSTGYYNLYSYDHFVTMCNYTIKNIMSNVVFQYPFYSGLPSLFFDGKKISFQSPASNWNSSIDSHYKIYFNTAAYRLFNSMPAKHLDKKDAFGRNFQLDTANFSNNFALYTNYHTLGGSVSNPIGMTFLNITQEYSTTANWSPVSSIAFTSASLHVEASHVSNLHEYDHGNEVIERSSNNSLTIITDFATSDYLPGILYVPSGEYRWVDLTKSGPLKKINVEVYWLSKLAEINPFQLSAGGSASLKMLFQKKNKFRR